MLHASDHVVADARRTRWQRAERTVLVTGASTGIGFATATRLACTGHRVVAGVRDADAAGRLLAADERIEPITLDITSDADIERLGAYLRDHVPGGLAGLVNNAGTVVVGPIETLGAQRWRDALEVNIIGTTQVTRVALPALLAAGGRVVNVSSPSGRVSLPLFSAYSVSKFALEAFNDALRREVGPMGVSVVCVQPGVIATPIYDKGLAAADQLIDEVGSAVYDRYDGLVRSAQRAAQDAVRAGRPPEDAAALITRVLGARRPRARYTLGRDARAAALIARLLPDRVLDAVLARLTAQ